jgi:hypothetical protein
VVEDSISASCIFGATPAQPANKSNKNGIERDFTRILVLLFLASK